MGVSNREFSGEMYFLITLIRFWVAKFARNKNNVCIVGNVMNAAAMKGNNNQQAARKNRKK